MGKLVWSMWARYMALSSAAILTNGSLWAFTYPYATIPALRKPASFLYAPIPAIGIFGLVFALLTYITEKPLIRLPLAIKPVLYFLASVVSFFQFSTLPAAFFLFLTAIVYMVAAVKGETMDDALNVQRTARPPPEKIGPNKV